MTTNWQKGPIYGPSWGICDWHHPDDRRQHQPSPDPRRPSPQAAPTRQWTERLVKAVRQIPAGPARGHFYDAASTVTLLSDNDATALDLVGRVERHLTRGAADALWAVVEQRFPTLNDGTRAAIARRQGDRYFGPLIQRRTAATALSAPSTAPSATDTTTISGLAVPYNARVVIAQLFEEEFAPGALDATTVAPDAEPTPMLLWHKADDWPIGRSQSWRSDQALHGTWRLNGTDKAVQAGEMARTGELGCLSIGFAPGVDKWQFRAAGDFDPLNGKFDRVRRITARLCEVSLVAAGSYPQARVTSVGTGEQRSRQPDITEQYPSSPAAWRIYRDRLRRQEQRPRPTRPTREIVAEYRRFLQAHR